MSNVLIFSNNLKVERKNIINNIYSKEIIKSTAIILLFIVFFFIKNVDKLKINNNSPLLPSKFKCSKNNNIKSLIFEIRNKSSINLLNYNTSISKNLISSLFGHNFSFFGFNNFSRENTLVKLGFNKKTNMGVYNLYVIPLDNNNWKKTISQYIISKYQKINRYLNYEEYGTKSGLYLNYKEMKKLFPFDYNYMQKLIYILKIKKK